MTSLPDAVALLRSLVERGHETATFDEDEMCFYCGAQKNYTAPKRLEDHNADCLYVGMIRFVEAFDSEAE